jgi:GNAT superfamily N-acetyltransferase
VLYAPLSTANDPRFKAAYAIYRTSIAVREQKSEIELAFMVAKPGYRFILAEQGDTVIGLAILFTAESDGFALLEYMAVDEKHRGTGVGSELFEETVRILHRQQAAMPMLLEVDSDREAAPDQLLRKRRQNFYRRLGCRRIAGCVYILPLPGETPPPEMDLFVHLTEPALPIARAALQRWLQVIYTDVYGCPADDPRIGMMLRGVADPIELL